MVARVPLDPLSSVSSRLEMVVTPFLRNWVRTSFAIPFFCSRLTRGPSTGGVSGDGCRGLVFLFQGHEVPKVPRRMCGKTDVFPEKVYHKDFAITLDFVVFFVDSLLT